MKTVVLESSSEDDDVYLNSVAKLKALKKKQTLVYDRQQDVEKAEEKAEELKVEVPKEDVERQRPSRKGRNRKKTSGSRSSRQRQRIPPDPDPDSDLEIVSVEKPNSSENDIAIVENYVNEVVHSSEEEDYELIIKILWRSKSIHRLNIYRNESFRKIFEYFANLEKVPIDEILITKKEKTIKRNDTPASINLSVIDILEGGIIKKDNTMLQNNLEQKNDADVCVIKVQTTSKKNIMVSVKRDESFQVVFTKCAQDLNVEESKIKLHFDGELVALTDTPDSLEIEDEACFDLRLSS